MGNVLYYGDNLDILRRYIKDESVDLIYLDPPFKSNQDYNVLLLAGWFPVGSAGDFLRSDAYRHHCPLNSSVRGIDRLKENQLCGVR